MNIRFSYLYRDAGNFKNFGEAIFSNPNETSLEDLSARVKLALLDEMYFDAYAVGLPELFFEDYDDELDHDWHEFELLGDSNASLETLIISIDEFILRLEMNKLN